jgi:ADP-ribose pyrophosphatase YjhB (NUDIX family)
MDNSRRGFDFIGVSAVALVHDGNGKLLLQKRGEQARDERGHWDLCGGAIEFGHTIEDTIRRELAEELCTEPVHMELLTAYDAHRTIDGRDTHWVAVVYAVQVDASTVKIGEPHKIAELGWFTSDNLPAPRHSQFEKSLVAARARGIIK